jgi:hypothetical protein
MLQSYNAPFSLSQDRDNMRLGISACTQSISLRSAWRENYTYSAPYFRGISELPCPCKPHPAAASARCPRVSPALQPLFGPPSMIFISTKGDHFSWGIPKDTRIERSRKRAGKDKPAITGERALIFSRE